MSSVVKEKPYFSLITVSYNSGETIERTIKSVLNQSCKDFEYIIVDGASTDSTMDIVKKYEKIFENSNIKFRVTSEPDKGIYDAMNKGIRMSSGILIGIVNSDDYYTDHALEDVKNVADLNPDIGIFHGIMREFDEGGTVRYIGYSSSVLPQKMIPHPTCFIRKKVYEENGLYDDSLKYAADYDYILRANKKGVKFLLLESVISNFSLMGVSQNSSKAFREGLKVRKNYHVEKRISLLFCYIKYIILKYRRKH